MSADLVIELGWKSALACTVALLASLALRGRPAAQRVAMLRAGVAALLLLPLLALTVPVLEIAVLPAVAALPVPDLPGGTVSAAMASEAPEIDWIALAYAMGAVLVLLRLVIGLIMLHRWTRHAVPASNPAWLEAIARAAEPLRRPVRLLVSRRVESPLSLGVLPATILIGPDVERCPERAAAVIAHEMAHVRRLDWPAMLASRVAVALFWFNPLVWLLAADLARQTELAADEEALAHVGRADYAQTLLAVAGGGGGHGACGMAVTRGALARRIRRVLEIAPRKPASGLLCAVLIGAIPLGIAPLAAMQLVPARPAPSPERVAEERPPAVPSANAPLRVEPARRAAAATKPIRPASRRAYAPGSLMALAKAPEPEVQAPQGFQPRFQARMAKWRKSLRAPERAEAPALAAKVEQPVKPLPVKTFWSAGPDARAQVTQRLEAVAKLRNTAFEYRERSRNMSLSPDVRQGYAKVADSLGEEARRLEKQARQMARTF